MTENKGPMKLIWRRDSKCKLLKIEIPPLIERNYLQILLQKMRYE